MSDQIIPDGLAEYLKPVRMMFIIGGTVALIAGVVIAAWPNKSAVFFTLVLAGYVLLSGLTYIVAATFSAGLRQSSRIALGFAGVALVMAAVFAFTNPARGAKTFATLVVIIIAAAWTIEAVVALVARNSAPSGGWAIIYAIVCVIAALSMLAAPLLAAQLWWLAVGITLALLGIVQIIRGARVGR